ncbi:DUF6286 domain-containing protein [Rhodococcus maanshanensis]|uniref:DUF6286 domain-containing Asp23/Gls24 family envelope stress response protein n=1 Tax=Rhodococcus maanshanensis TaxID=183556 RepID=UPI0022B4ECAC|nr:DUF6286 domain-containing Asp23/Gls24 family envelope stress response protein [Rhodococcus maanshanensis]MCZ4555331.1 DUF6286 domain-containing protein [Rhodococcus maanshanensis]
MADGTSEAGGATRQRTADADLDEERSTRGQLIIKDRAVSRIAVAAALQVPGVVRQRGGLSRLTGRDLPRAEVSMGTESVAVTLYIAVAWPCPIALLSREVHREVGDRIAALSGLPMDQLHVVVAAAVPTAAPEGAEVDSQQFAAPGAALAPLVPSRAPITRPAAAPVALLFACALLVLAVLTGREFLIAHEVIAPAAWLRNSIEWSARQHWEPWMVPAAAAAVFAGLVLIFVAVKPRIRTHLPLGDAGSAVVWVRPTDVARMCSAQARTVAGVRSVQTIVDGKRTTVRISPDGEVAAPALESAVRDAVEPGLATLATPRPLRVRIGKVQG